jgi:hypothetical protein
MVPRNYWTAERIQQQRKNLNKQPSKLAITITDDKILQDLQGAAFALSIGSEMEQPTFLSTGEVPTLLTNFRN